MVAWLEGMGHGEHAVGVTARPVIDPRSLPPGLGQLPGVCAERVSEQGIVFERESSVTRNVPV